jgi:4-amino-4-deoxy-L-arabinose transferase-like glycosyltransferase
VSTSWRTSFGGLLLSLLILKLWLAAQLPLFTDEAFYWLESRHLAWAYDDVPGLTPWLIRLGESPAEGQPWAVRWPFALLSIAAIALLVRTAGAVGRPGDGWIAGTLALLLPLFAVNGLLALPDVPLTLAVLMCAEALRRLLQHERMGAVLLATAITLGWLSHYRFAVPYAAAGIWLLLHPLGRQLLGRRDVWAAGLTGSALGLAPLLWHQFFNAGGGIAFQFVDRHPWRLQPEGVLDPLLQALVATPLLFVLLLASVWSAVRRPQRPERTLIGGLALAIFASYMLLGPFVDAERSRLHWPLPALLLATTLAPQALADAGRIGRRSWAAALGLAAAVLGAMLMLASTLALTPARLADREVYLHGFTGWREAVDLTAQALATLPTDTLLVADHFALAAQLAFASGGSRPVYSLDHAINLKHGRQGELARMGLDERGLQLDLAGRPALVVLEESATRLRERPAWFRRLCQRFPGARVLFDHSVDHGRKRLIGYFQAADADSGCVPPALGYLVSPVADSVVEGVLDISGWAIRDGAGLRALRASLGDVSLGAVDHLQHADGVQMIFPGSDDPRHPQVGFAARLHSDLPAGRYWLQIEAEGHDGARAIVVSTPIEWRPGPAQGSR